VRRTGLILVLMAIPLAVVAQDDANGIDVIDVSGPLDGLALDFITDSVELAASTGQELAVVQVSSKAVLDGEAFDRLWMVMADPPLPVAIWIGPAPAVAYGGAGVLTYSVNSVGEAAISPGSEIGKPNPVVLGEGRAEVVGPAEVLTAEESGLDLQPTIRQYLQNLNGKTFETAAGPVEVTTIVDYEDGVTLKPVTFRKPGLITRFFRLAVTPEAAFFFLVIGLSIVTFEFFALGPGVAAAVAATSLILAGWGITTLPMRWWALALVFTGWITLTAAYQKGGVIFMTGIGTVLILIGGLFFIDGGGQINPRWWLVLPSVLGVLFFFLLAMPTVQRARLSTQTIGRDDLVSLVGIATSEFDPEGYVEVNGAVWRATAHREAGIQAGDSIIVMGVDGLFLEVSPNPEERET
jgi:membrane-bound serine protease (ClpP class)